MDGEVSRNYMHYAALPVQQEEVYEHEPVHVPNPRDVTYVDTGRLCYPTTTSCRHSVVVHYRNGDAQDMGKMTKEEIWDIYCWNLSAEEVGHFKPEHLRAKVNRNALKAMSE